MLFSPSLHAATALPIVTNANGVTDQLVAHNSALGRAARMILARHAQEECFIFSMSGLTPDANNAGNFTVSPTIPKVDIRWPFNWICTGIRQSVTFRPTTGTAAGINVMRNTFSIFDNTTTIGTSNCQIAAGGTNVYSSKVSPHASHVSWSVNDSLRMYLTAGASGSTTQTNNFHASKIYFYGYRR